MSSTPTPEQRVAANDHIVRVINDAWLAMVLSLGERLGLTEALAELESTDAAALAATTGTGRRYVEDWLWSLVAGEIAAVERDAAGVDRFSLRPGYAESMTARGGAGNWGRIAEQLVAMSSLEDDLVDAVRHGGGLPASAYEGRIVEVLAVESGPILEASLLDEVVPLLDLHDTLDRGARVLDAGCGSGEALAILAERYPRSSFVGLDQSHDAVSTAQDRADRRGLANVAVEVADLEEPWPAIADGPFDLVLAVNVVHDLAEPARFFDRAKGVLRPGGTLALLELAFSADMHENVAHPHAIGVLAFGLYHCLPLAQRRPGIAPGGMWGSATYAQALRDAGFDGVRVERAPSDPTNDLILARRPRTEDAS